MRIFKRKKGRQEYYYLQHSFRQGKKIITKEKYLGKRIPDNIEKIKEELKKEVQHNLYIRLKSVKKDFQENWKKLPPSVKEKELEEISICFTYNTNAIEGSTITLDEAREIIQDHIAPNKPLRDIKETEAHSKVFLEMLLSKREVNKEILLNWHKEIFSSTKPDVAGKIRDYLVRVGSYLAPDWQEVEKMIEEYLKYLNAKNTLNPVEFAAIMHYRFEKIHPFGDGNGRIGRLIMNQILWHSGYPMLIIEYKKRKSYYKALRKDEEGFVKYFIKRYLAVHKKRVLAT